MLYLALWDPPDQPARPRSVLKKPQVSHFVADWGKDGDIGFAAMSDAKSVGAIWTRLKDPTPGEGYGCDYPELGIALLPDYQGRGAGSLLMTALIDAVRPQAQGLRLGVHPQNERAIGLYRKHGFSQYAIGLGDYPQMKINF